MAPNYLGQQELKEFKHGEDTAHLTIALQTNIRMPNLHWEESYGALFVLDEDVPNEMINRVLEEVAESNEGDTLLWLADESLDDLPGAEEYRSTTEPPIPSTWRSPFIGKTIEAAFQYLATIPLDRSVIREYIAVLDRRLYEQKNWLVLYKIDDDGEITVIPCSVEMSTAQMGTYDPDEWPPALEAWRVRGRPIM